MKFFMIRKDKNTQIVLGYLMKNGELVQNTDEACEIATYEKAFANMIRLNKMAAERNETFCFEISEEEI